MDMNSRFTMVLLSTLAAFVIIVHSAEENRELSYRRDLRLRDSDNETSPQYEQTWRVHEIDSKLHKMVQLPTDSWNSNSPVEPPKRKRKGRKRKRRPQQQNPPQDLMTQERYTLPDQPQQSYIETNVRNMESEESSKTKQKKLDQSSNQWHSDTSERPLRRRVRKRKRPLLTNRPELSEFNTQAEKVVLESISDPNDIADGRIYTDTEGIRQLIEQNRSGNDEHPEVQTERTLIDIRGQQIQDRIVLPKRKFGKPKLTFAKEDKSLSEFSIEMTNGRKAVNNDDMTDQFQDKITEKSPRIKSSFNKVQSKEPTDPISLKDILKRSNGTSLSEILQQHNLSLADLLSGRESALSKLRWEDSLESTTSIGIIEYTNPITDQFEKKNIVTNISKANIENSDESLFLNLETKHGIRNSVLGKDVITQSVVIISQEDNNDNYKEILTSEKPETTTKIGMRRRLPESRKRLRIRPIINSIFKNQSTHGFMTLNPRQEFKQLRRNSTKPKEVMTQENHTQEFTFNSKEVTTNASVEINTIINALNGQSKDATSAQASLSNESTNDVTNTQIEITTIANAVSEMSELNTKVNEKQKVITHVPRQTVNSSTLRQQAFINRMNKKRQRNKNSTTESSQNSVFKNLPAVNDLVSSSEFIAKTESPKQEDNLEITTSLEDVVTTVIPKTVKQAIRSRGKSIQNKISTTSTTTLKTTTITTTTTTTETPYISSSTEDTSRIEIEEILNVIETSARLAKILKERNMTLTELVEHRERGSSNIHLADIFHNTSKEPKPPVPFLSKSLLEPISKETYPLRALLEANLHDPNAKVPEPTTVDPVKGYINIPVAMDFRNNVNENAENMGIMSLFSNFTKHDELNKQIVEKSNEDGLHDAIATPNNITEAKDNNSTRQGKMMHTNNTQDDMVSWNEIFTLMRTTNKNETGKIPETLTTGPAPVEPLKKITLEEDVDGDGLIIVEDLQHLKDFDSKVLSRSNEKIEVKAFERSQTSKEITGTPDMIPSQKKSVTVATSCIAALAIFLFLLMYAAFKWKQEKRTPKKRASDSENIPTPVFENRKGNQNNSSMRSISPMLSTSNNFTQNTLDTRNETESPEYMWDSTRKPFQ